MQFGKDVNSDSGFFLTSVNMVALPMAQGLTADMFLQLTTTLAHMSALNNNVSLVDNNVDVDKNGNDQINDFTSNNGTFLKVERG